jgi:hypothetical protein
MKNILKNNYYNHSKHHLIQLEPPVVSHQEKIEKISNCQHWFGADNHCWNAIKTGIWICRAEKGTFSPFPHVYANICHVQIWFRTWVFYSIALPATIYGKSILFSSKKRKEGTPNDFTSGALSIIVPASSYGLKSWILHKDSFEYLPSYMILCLRYIHHTWII